MEELNEEAKLLIRLAPLIVNRFAAEMFGMYSLSDLMKANVKIRSIRTPEDLRPPIETREG